MQIKKMRLLGLCVLSVAFMSWTINKIEKVDKTKVDDTHTLLTPEKPVAAMEKAYDSLELEDLGLSHQAFDYAINGFQQLEQKGVLQNDSVLTIVDFDQPSYKKRMYVIDVKNFKVLFNTLVAHGKNTGKEIAQFFSNANQSFKSSLGFYLTDTTYNGGNGYSLKLKGLEANLNGNAMKRAIVIHGASYVSQSFIDAQGYIGRSHGCPAIPTALTRPIIETIKNGSCLFIYNKSYKPSGSLING